MYLKSLELKIETKKATRHRICTVEYVQFQKGNEICKKKFICKIM
jgi:hypothetical protein